MEVEIEPELVDIEQPWTEPSASNPTSAPQDRMKLCMRGVWWGGRGAVKPAPPRIAAPAISTSRIGNRCRIVGLEVSLGQ